MTRPAPSAALLDRLSKRFAGNPGYVAWVARQAGPDRGLDGVRGDVGPSEQGPGNLVHVAKDQQLSDVGRVRQLQGALDGQPPLGPGLQGVVDAHGAPLNVVLAGHAADSESAQAPAQALPRGGHTELALERLTHEDARIRRGGRLPAVWSAYS